MPEQKSTDQRHICFITGTRAEYGLMVSTLQAIKNEPGLSLQIIATGMHLSRAHGMTINQILHDGWHVDARVPWRGGSVAENTGQAIAAISRAFETLQPHIVLVTGDRPEAFAGATAAHLGGICVAHVHGGDRALGQVDDALRHAISRLAHIHFPATKQSRDRLYATGEDAWRLHCVGTPGLDDVPKKRVHKSGVMLMMHPESADEALEYEQAMCVLRAVQSVSKNIKMTIIHPNNDPGWRGIARAWEDAALQGHAVYQSLSRDIFLQQLASAGVLVGNSSSGIIEAASTGTFVINTGRRQLGRQRSKNVIDVNYNNASIARAIRRIMPDNIPQHFTGPNVYGKPGAGRRIARILADVKLNTRLMQKLIRY
jgi:GDP/UDP-N,N'-diacetylbacillosamine 2-epimerase (hydrolysing)